jgi:RPA family protein
MADEQFKRHIAFKFRVGDLLGSKPVMNGDKFSHIELNDKKVIRVNIAGNIVDRYESSGDKKYSFLTLDDGSGQIKLKIFGDDVEKFKEVNQGQTVVVIGLVRNWNNETYLAPEIIREFDPRYLLVRKLEMEKERSKNFKPMGKQQVIEVKDKIIDLIRGAESAGGIDTEIIVTNLKDVSPEVINQELYKLLEEGIIFEPRPGKVRYLG